MLVKKYMRTGDIYMHADFHGAATTIIKNPARLEAISPLSLDEAAIATVCRSKAWESKLLASAWWVYDHQVSKRAETGEFLPHGSFMIRGKKNFLYPNRMEMGGVILFKIEDQESIDRHQEDRKIRIPGAQSSTNLNEI
jgi:predicted ribosome quality control (RQC) complex YloA/Tae2 family protein